MTSSSIKENEAFCYSFQGKTALEDKAQLLFDPQLQMAQNTINSTVPAGGRVKLISGNWMIVNKIKAVFGEDPQLNSDFGQFHYTIIVDIEKKGMALRALLPKSLDGGDGPMTISVRTSQGKEYTPCAVTTIDQLVDVLRAAFAGNSRFVEAREVPPPLPTTIKYAGLIMTDKLVQFHSDDLSEVYRNFNGVTAHVTSELINMSFQKGTLLIEMGTRPLRQPEGKQ